MNFSISITIKLPVSVSTITNYKLVHYTWYYHIVTKQKFRQAQVPLYCRNIRWNKFSPMKNFTDKKFHQLEQVAKLVKISAYTVL